MCNKQKVKLEDKYIQQLKYSSENGMGFHIVDLHLKNGTILKNIIVLNCSILKIENNITIENADIEKIVISNN